MSFYLGVDLGQRQDHTAIALVERAGREPRVGVRGVERVPLGTTYPQVVERVAEIVYGEEIRGQCYLVVDGTGVGAPVMDMLRAARLGCEICEVTITGGMHARQTRAGGMDRWSVPKRDLLAGMQLLLERGDLRIARRMRETGALVRELVKMRATVRAQGKQARLGADGCGEHDDLAIAVALACWRAGRQRMVSPSGRLPGM